MSAIRKSVTSEHQSVATKNSVPEPPKQEIGVIKPMSQNVYSGSDKNDQPVMDEDPLLLLKQNGKITQLKQQAPPPPTISNVPVVHNARNLPHSSYGINGNTQIKFNNRPYTQTFQQP